MLEVPSFCSTDADGDGEGKDLLLLLPPVRTQRPEPFKVRKSRTSRGRFEGTELAVTPWVFSHTAFTRTDTQSSAPTKHRALNSIDRNKAGAGLVGMKQEGKSGNRDKNPTGTILSIKYPSEPLGLRGSTAQPPTEIREENSPDFCSFSRCNEDQREEGEMWKLLASNTAQQSRKVPNATKGRAEVGLSLEIRGRKKRKENNNKKQKEKSRRE